MHNIVVYNHNNQFVEHTGKYTLNIDFLPISSHPWNFAGIDSSGALYALASDAYKDLGGNTIPWGTALVTAQDFAAELSKLTTVSFDSIVTSDAFNGKLAEYNTRLDALTSSSRCYLSLLTALLYDLPSIEGEGTKSKDYCSNSLVSKHKFFWGS